MAETPVMAGLGVDLVRISRFDKYLEDPSGAMLKRLFTPGERHYCLAKRNPSPHLAARFAAKEALLKALGTGLRSGLSWQDMDIVRDSLGKPSFALSGRTAEIVAERALRQPWLSYSHDGDYATATVILELRCEP